MPFQRRPRTRPADTQAGYRLLSFVEPVSLREGSIFSLLGGLAGVDAVTADCSWSVGSAGQLLVRADRLSAGGRNWEPADKQAKALRVLSACTPVFLDDSLLVLRAQLEGVLFVFEKL